MERFVQIGIARHIPADALKQTQLLLRAIELLLKFSDSAGHELYYCSVWKTSVRVDVVLAPQMCKTLRNACGGLMGGKIV